MELEQLKLLLSNPEELQKAMAAEKPEVPDELKLETLQKQYDPRGHAIMDTALRLDKVIKTDSGTETVKVARLPVSMQKRIVRLAATFLCGRPIELSSEPKDQTETDLLAVIRKTWKDNKLDYKSKKIAKLMMSETEAAELWYTEQLLPDEGYWVGTANDQASVKFKLRMKILAPSLGDTLLPVYNTAGDMIAFGRGYTTKVDGNNVEHLDVYTAETINYFEKGSSGWGPSATFPSGANIMKKIPVIYYSQEKPEWYDVQQLIERLENSFSNHADTNDYHGSPTIKVKGEVKGFAKKGEQGKIIELEGENADAEYMGWTHAPESVKLEQENLMNLIHMLTDTPNISFEQMKSLGTFSGIALKMLFMGAHMKASDHEENFGESIQRRINFLLAAMAVINVKFEKVKMTIEPAFTYFLPKNEQEIVEMLSTSVTSGTLSKQTALSHHPWVKDPDAELKLIEKEKQSAGALDDDLS